MKLRQKWMKLRLVTVLDIIQLVNISVIQIHLCSQEKLPWVAASWTLFTASWTPRFWGQLSFV